MAKQQKLVVGLLSIIRKSSKQYFKDEDLKIKVGEIESQLLEKEFVDFSERIAKQLPKTRVVFVAVRPSLARVAIVDKQKDLNKRIEQFMKGKKNLFYLDMHAPFYLADGTLMQDIFIADQLHLNEKGYQIFASKIRSFIETSIIK
jgi:lysophospholipase L1-like esterase